MKARDALLGMTFAVVVVLSVACGSSGDSNSEPTGRSFSQTPLPTEEASLGGDLLSYQAAFIGVQDTVNLASIGIVKGLLEFEACVTDEECGDAILLVGDEYEPYIAVLDDQIRVLNEINPPPTWRTLHENYIEQLTLRQSAGELWIAGLDLTLDEATAVGMLALSLEKYRESNLVTIDILEDVQDLIYLDAFARKSEDIIGWIDGLNDLAEETTDDTSLSDYQESLNALTVEIALLDDEVQRLSPPDKFASAHASFETVVGELHRSQRLRDEGLTAGNNSVFVEETTALDAAVDAFYEAASRIIDIGKGN